MRIICFITVCAYLSSTVSTDEIKSLDRIKKGRLREDLTLRDFTVQKEVNSIPEIYSNVYPTLERSRPNVQIDMFPEPKITHEHKLGPQQHRHYSRGRSRHSLKRLKTRSIVGTSYELNDNHLNELTKPIPEVHHEGSIHIEPVLRVTTKKNVFDSIVNILRQLLHSPKNELGPLVGPIQVPGSGRKIYLRLMEPVESSHVMVRFVTQVPVPVTDAEFKHTSFIPLPPIIHPGVFLKSQSVVLPDAVFASSRHLHRNVSHTPGKTQAPQLGKSSVLHLPKDSSKNLPGVGTSGKQGLLPGKGEETKNPFAELNLKNHDSPFFGEPNSYYQAAEDAVNQVNQLLNDTKPVVENDSKDPSGPWYELSTHRLPLRQIAPLYSLASVEHAESSASSSHANTYKVPSDVFTGPSLYTSPYAQFNPDTHTNSYDQHHGTSSSYLVSHNKPNDVHTTPNSSYSISYQQQNKFNGDPSSYPPTSYQDQLNNGPSSYSVPHQDQLNNGPSSYSLPYGTQNDLYSASSSYVTSYSKPSNAPLPSSSSPSHEDHHGGSQIASNSNDALRIIDPPSYIAGYQRPTENHVNRSSAQHFATRQPFYHLQILNEVGSNTQQRGDHQIIWGEAKRGKSESSFRQNKNSSEAAEARDRWQPIVYVRENRNWQEAYADLAKVANNHRIQPFERTRKISRNHTLSSLNERGGPVDRRENTSRRRSSSAPVPRASKCAVSSKEDGCERAKPALILHSEKPTKVVEKQTQPAVEAIVAVASKAETNNTVKNTRLADGKNLTTSSTTSSSTEGSSPLIVTPESPTLSSMTEIPLPLIKTTKSPVVSSTTERFVVSLKTNGPTVNNVKPTIKPTIKSTIKLTTKLTEKPTIKLTTKLTIKSPMKPIMKPTSNVEKSPTIGSVTTNAPASSDTAKKLLPKRRMVMRKPAFIMKQMESSTTMKQTVASSTTQNPTQKATRKSTFRSAISRAKSNTT